MSARSRDHAARSQSENRLYAIFNGSVATLGNGRVGEKALVRSWGIIEDAYSDLRRVFGAGHHNTRWALSVRDHIRETHGSMVVLESSGGVELFGRNITWGAIWAAVTRTVNCAAA